jgi:S1-C subfamily serine protease
VLLVLGGLVLAVLLLSGTSPPGHTQEAFTAVAESVNRKLVKVYGSGGFQGIASGGTGVLVSSQGHILTVATQMLDTRDLRVHLWDGRRLKAEVVVIEPELDLALLKIRPPDNLPLEPLEHFDISQAAQQPLAKPGDWVLAISNMFQVATREEPMSVQRGVIAAYGKLPIQRGYTEAPFAGEVYVIDAVTNNPGAAGGALVNRKGQLLGLIGRELRNRQTETWINYAIPVQAAVKVDEDGKDKLVRAVDLVELGVQGKYRPAVVTKRREGKGAYTGIVLVPSPVERTPPYIEDVLPGSPAALAKLRPDDSDRLCRWRAGQHRQSVQRDRPPHRAGHRATARGPARQPHRHRGLADDRAARCAAATRRAAATRYAAARVYPQAIEERHPVHATID